MAGQLAAQSLIDFRRSGPDYGSTSEEDDTADAQGQPKIRRLKSAKHGHEAEGFHKMINKHGGPRILFQNAWLALLPIIAPLVIINYYSLSSGFFFLRCKRAFPEVTFARAVCSFTYVNVSVFPVVCRITGVFLVTWRLVRQRLFYVFLDHKIVLDLDNCSFLARLVRKVQLTIFSLALVHFVLKAIYGNQRGPHGEPTTTPLLNVSLREFLQNPHIVFAPDQMQFVEFLNVLCSQWLIPAVLAIFFTSDIDDAETTLIPFCKLLEYNPGYVTQHINESVGVREGVAREILEEQDQEHTQEELETASVQRAIAKSDSLEAYNIFRREALEFEDVYVIQEWKPGIESDMENAAGTQAGRKIVELPPLDLCYILFKSWWPLAMLLKDETRFQKTPIQFRRTWCYHLIGVSIVVSGDVLLRIVSCIVNCLRFYWGTGFTAPEVLVMMLSASAVIIGGLSAVLRTLIREVRENW